MSSSQLDGGKEEGDSVDEGILSSYSPHLLRFLFLRLWISAQFCGPYTAAGKIDVDENL